MVSEALDSIFKDAELSETMGDHLLALGLEVPAQFIFTNLGKAVTYLVTGLALLGAKYGIHDMSARNQHDALEFSGHFLNRAIALGLDPATVAAIATDVGTLKAGNLTGAFVRSSADITALVNQLISSYQAIITPGVASAGARSYSPGPAVVAAPGAAASGFTVPGYIGVAPAMAGGAQGSIF